MKNLSVVAAVLCLSIPFLFTSCHQNQDSEVEPTGITCPTAAEVYAYRGTHTDTVYAPYSCVFGMINTATGSSTSMASFMGDVYFNQGAYHITEGNYYAFKSIMDTTRTLFRISPSGTVTTLTNSATGNRFDGLVYNRHNGRLYCFRNSGGIAEVTVTGSSYTATDVAATIHPELYDNATVDPATGDIYFQTHDLSTTTYNIEKYQPGGAVTTVSSGMPVDLSGMRYNANDGMLYAIRPGGAGYDFVKINSAGTITTISSLSYVNTKFYSACIDPCSNHYLLAYRGFDLLHNGHLIQLDMSGTVIRHDSATTMYQGLAVKY
jgi:hypothetical protein